MLLCKASLPGCPVQSGVLLSESKANPGDCIRSSTVHHAYRHLWYTYQTMSIKSDCRHFLAVEVPEEREAISRPFAMTGCSPLYGLALLSLRCRGRPKKGSSYHIAYEIVLEASLEARRGRSAS